VDVKTGDSPTVGLDQGYNGDGLIVRLDEEYKALWEKLNENFQEKKRLEFVETINRVKERVLGDVEELSNQI